MSPSVRSFFLRSLLCLVVSVVAHGSAAFAFPSLTRLTAVAAADVPTVPVRPASGKAVELPAPPPIGTAGQSDSNAAKILEKLESFDRRFNAIELRLSTVDAALKGPISLRTAASSTLAARPPSNPAPSQEELTRQARKRASAQTDIARNPNLLGTGGKIRTVQAQAQADSVFSSSSTRFRAGESFNHPVDDPTYDVRRLLKPNVSLRVQNQLTCGSCWAFAAIATFEANYALKFGEMADASEQYILNCTPKESNGDTNDCGGGYLDSALNTLATRGTIRRADSGGGYEAQKNGCVDATIAYKAKVWGTIDIGTRTSTEIENAIKRAVKENGAVGVSIVVSSVFKQFGRDNLLNDNAVWLGDLTATRGENHFVCIVGWSNNIPGFKGQAWLVKNSWGTDWGHKAGFGNEAGYMWVKFGASQIGQFVCFAQADQLGPQTTTQPERGEPSDGFYTQLVRDRNDWWQTNLPQYIPVKP